MDYRQADTPNSTPPLQIPASHAARLALLHKGGAVTNQSQAHPIASLAITTENTHCRRALSTHSRRGCCKGGTREVDELLSSKARDGHELSGHGFVT